MAMFGGMGCAVAGAMAAAMGMGFGNLSWARSSLLPAAAVDEEALLSRVRQ